MSHSCTPTQVFDSLWQLAQCACTLIEQEAPDLLLVLYKSGRIVQVALETLWAATHEEPLPPLLAVNLGTEKLKTYFDYDWPYHDLEYSGPEEIGRLLAWVQSQGQWLEPLQAQVAQTLGRETPPLRILVLDDVIDHGATALLTLGLLWTLYPEREVTLLAGLPPAWRQTLGWQWIEEENPEALERLVAKLGENGVLPAEQRRKVDGRWAGILMGMIDDYADPLGWLPLVEDGVPLTDIFMALGPLSLFLEAAPYLEQRVVTFIHQALADKGLSTVVPAGRTARHRPQRMALRWEEKLWSYAWQQRSVSVAELQPVCAVPNAEIGAALESYVANGTMCRFATAGVPRYTIPPRLGTLACGSTLTAPEPALVAVLWTEEPDLQVQLSLEYAYANPLAAGAPQLTPVDGIDQPLTNVPVYPIAPATFDVELLNPLYRRARAEYKQAGMEGGQAVTPKTKLRPQWLNDVAGLEHIPYYPSPLTLPFVLDQGIPAAVRGRRLAELALASLTAATYQAGTDGIHYLATALRLGIQTPLTPHYERAILHLVGDAPDLAAARELVAKRQGWI